MAGDESVTLWIEQLKAGDPLAAQKLWERYFAQLVRCAQKRLSGAPRRMADEEDAAISAFDSFCRSAAAGKFPQLNDRDDLWQLLVTITARKAADQVNRERAAKRGAGLVRGDSVFLASPESDHSPYGMGDVVGSEPTPEFVAQMADEVQRLLVALADDGLREIALSKMQGYTNEEIAQRLGCVPRTIERRVRVIRSIWEATGSEHE